MTHDDPYVFHKHLYDLFTEARIKRPRLTQEEFANEIGISLPCLKSYLNRKHDPSGSNLRSIAKACNVSVDWLLGLQETRHQDKSFDVACKNLQLSERTITTLHDISTSPYREAYDAFFSCGFERLMLLLHYLQKFINLEKESMPANESCDEKSVQHIEPGSFKRVSNDTVLVNDSDLREMYLCNAEQEFSRLLHSSGGIVFLDESLTLDE